MPSWKDSAHLCAQGVLNLIVLFRSAVQTRGCRGLGWQVVGLERKRCPALVPVPALWVQSCCHPPIIITAIVTLSMESLFTCPDLIHLSNVAVISVPRIVWHKSARFSVCLEKPGKLMFSLPERCSWYVSPSCQLVQLSTRPYDEVSSGSEYSFLGQVEADQPFRPCLALWALLHCDSYYGLISFPSSKEFPSAIPSLSFRFLFIVIKYALHKMYHFNVQWH